MTDSIDLISLLPVIISVVTLGQLAKNWSKFWDDKVTSADQQLAQQLAIFLLVPLGVLLHEIGHSLATWQMGGMVKTFRWYFFSGYIIPSGNFSLAEYWWIVFAGNLVSILLGLLPITLITRVHKRIMGEILYFFACIQSIYALILYPVWSVFSRSGDWSFIYDFNLIPSTSLLLLGHLLLLWRLWKIYRSYAAIQWRLARNPNIADVWKRLNAEQGHRPNDLQPKLDLFYFLMDHGEVYEAKQIAQIVLDKNSQDPRVKVLEVVMAFRKKADHQAIKAAKKLLQISLLLEDQLRLYRILCVSLNNISQPSEALDYANQGLTLAPEDYKLRCNRALVYQGLQQYQKAIADLDIALNNAPDEDMREQIWHLKRKYFRKV